MGRKVLQAGNASSSSSMSTEWLLLAALLLLSTFLSTGHGAQQPLQPPAEGVGSLGRQDAGPGVGSPRHPFTSLAEFQALGYHRLEPVPLQQLQPATLAEWASRAASMDTNWLELDILVSPAAEASGQEATAFLETSAKLGAKKVENFCEVCIHILQRKQRGEPHLCAGLHPDYVPTCVKNLESLLHTDKALVYWMKNGCLHLDAGGPEVVRPCPALPICSWVPNLFSRTPKVTPHAMETLCPRDSRFLPTIPEEYMNLKFPAEKDAVTGLSGPARTATSAP